MNNQLKKLCLSGEGKGRMSLLSNKVLFSYESINDIEKKVWKMGVDIPLHGSELLSLDWSDLSNFGGRFKGKFARRIYVTLRNHKNSKENLANLKSFADGFGQVIYLKEKMHLSDSLVCNEKNCNVGKKEIEWKFNKGHLLFDYSSHLGNVMRFDFSNLTDEGPKKLSIYPLESKLLSNSFKLELFFNSCK